MPKTYAQRFAELIAAEPNLNADYSVQLYDREFAQEVVLELERMNIPAKIDPISGILRVHLSKHDTRGKGGPRPEDGSDEKGAERPRKLGDRVDFSALLLTRLGVA